MIANGYMPDAAESLEFEYMPRGDRPGLRRAARYLVADVIAFPLVGLGFVLGAIPVVVGCVIWNTLGRPSEPARVPPTIRRAPACREAA